MAARHDGRLTAPTAGSPATDRHRSGASPAGTGAATRETNLKMTMAEIRVLNDLAARRRLSDSAYLRELLHQAGVGAAKDRDLATSGPPYWIS